MLANSSADPFHYYSAGFLADDGYYTLTVPSGLYTVTALAPFNSPFVDRTYPSPVSATAPLTSAGVNLSLNTGGVLAGRVTDGLTGAGLPNVNVVVYHSDQSFVPNLAVTDASGYYTFPVGLPSGGYLVGFSQGFAAGGPRYQDVFYQDHPDLGSADVITITAPGLTSLNGAMRRCPGLVIYVPLVQR